MAQHLRGYKKVPQELEGYKRQFWNLQKLNFYKLKNSICTPCQCFSDGYRTNRLIKKVSPINHDILIYYFYFCM